MKKGANIEAADEEGRTPLHIAASKDCVEVVKLLLEKGAKKEVADKYGLTPLLLAPMKGHTKVVKLLSGQ